MVGGIWLAIFVLVLGISATLTCRHGEEGPSAVVSMLIAVLVLVLTLLTTNQSKTLAEELEALQQHCIRQGIATMTPVVTQSKFQLLPVTIAEVEIECGSTTAEME